MNSLACYSAKIKEYKHIFKDTVAIYRYAVDFFIGVCMNEWDGISALSWAQLRQRYVEQLCHATKDNPSPKYPDFDRLFYKFPSYLRRSVVNEAVGKVSSYKSNHANWETADRETRGREPGRPKAGHVYPCMYRGNMYQRTGTYKAKIKVFIHNTWDWIEVGLRKSDIDYITRHCAGRKHCAPTLQKRGKEWFLDFVFEETVSLTDKPIYDQTVVAVDLGINSAATVSVMRPDGTVAGRYFCKLPAENDSLGHAVNRIKKAQQHGNRKMPRLWGRAKGINKDIAVKTAAFIMGIAVLYQADVIVFEHLGRKGKNRGSKKQRLHLWRSQYVQAIVTDRAHHLGMRVSRVCAWGTSRLAYDGSGRVKRGEEAGLPSYSMCRFQNGKAYNCDLSASYNIGARYFIREILKSLPEMERLALEAKAPQAAKRSTCTLSTLISLNAELMTGTA